MKASDFIVPLIVTTLFISGADIISGIDFFKQIGSSGYSKTTGTIKVSEITLKSGIRNSSRPEASIRYVYNISGQDFIGYFYRYITIDAPEKIVATYKVGDPVDVFYNPKSPKDSILSIGLDPRDWRQLRVLILVNASLALGWLLFYFKNKPARLTQR